jgi:nucleoid-associated protein YgaU
LLIWAVAMIKKMKRLAVVMIAVVVSFLLFTTVPAVAQTVADAARQERERKKASGRATHVYTNEDLAKPQILVPEEEARVARGDAAPDSGKAPVPSGGSVASSARSQRLGEEKSPVPAVSVSAQTKPKTQPEKLVPPESASSVYTNRSDTGNRPPAANAATKNISVAASSAPAAPQATPWGQIPLPDTNLPKQLQAAAPLGNARPMLSVPALGVPSLVTPPSSFRADFVATPVNLPAPVSGPPMGVDALKTVTAPAERPIAHATSLSSPATLLGVARETVRPSLTERTIVRPTSPIPSPLAHPAQQDPLLKATIKPNAQPISAKASQPADKSPVSLVAGRSPLIESGTVQVQPGDSLWKLAQRFLRAGRRWRELATLNPQLADPGLIRPGDLIHLPIPTPGDVKKILVQPGDTLWSVAQAEFGRPLAFSCIAQANPQLQSVNLIRAGQMLVVPEACAVYR